MNEPQRLTDLGLMLPKQVLYQAELCPDRAVTRETPRLFASGRQEASRRNPEQKGAEGRSPVPKVPERVPEHVLATFHPASHPEVRP